MDANIVKATKQPSGSGHPRVVMGEITAIATRYRANYSIPMSNPESSKLRVETAAGRFVSGYRIVTRITPPV
jgi:hypothetical protein